MAKIIYFPRFVRVKPDHSVALWSAVGWLAMAVTVLGSYGMALGHLFASSVLLFIGSAGWFAKGYFVRDWAMVTMQGILFVSEIMAMWRYF